jgi:hypothetical protein
MSKCRVYKFEIKNVSDEELNTIYNSKFEYLLVCKKQDNTIQGLIRFSIQKSLKIVFNIFLKKASLELSLKTDKAYREEFTSNSTILFESGKIPKITNTENRFNELIEENKKSNIILSQQSVQIQELLKLKEETEQLKQITNICLAIAKNTPSVTNSHNKINNKFNINIFLNEHCKNAINLIDFVKGIQIELQDLLLFTKVGHAEAVSKIFDKAYNKLDLTMRPVHCTDVKRETLYVRNKNEWLNDESKEISEKAMDIVSNSSYNQMKNWKEANPEYESSHEKNIEYLRLMKNVLGATSDAEENSDKKKFIRNISQSAFLDKDQALTIMNPNL